MTLYGADGHVSGYTMKYGYTLWAGGKNLRFERLRMIKADLRDFDTEKRSDLLCSNQLYIDTASRFVTVEGCRFHSKACAVWINFYDGPRYAQPILFEDDRQVRFVTIRGCDFYGYTFPYVHPDGRRPRGDEGEISRGITAMNVENMIVENCRFLGRDQKHDQVLTRSMYIPITANRMFIADNLMLNVGSTPGTGFDGNTGEQILLHGGLHLGGVYNVKKCEGDRLTVRRDNIVLYDESGRLISPEDTVTNAGSIVTDGLKRGRRGMAYIASGKGVGQIRQIDGYEETSDAYVFLLHRPFTVEPDETSVIVETAPFRENLIVRNTIMKETPTYSHGFKSGGVLLFFDSYRNVIAENDFRHLAFGVSLNAAFKCPVLMNTVRDNRFTGIREAYYDAMQGGDSTRNATCFCESVVGNAGEQAGWDDYTVWYTQGNVFRSNRCFDCDSAAEIATNRWNNLRNAGIDRYFGEEKGACMTVVENNSFRSVAQGILVGNPAYWPLIRNNGFRFSEKPGFLSDKIRYDQNPMNYRLMQIEGDAVIADECRTVNPRLSGFERSARRQAHPGSDAGGHVIPAALAYIEAHFTEPIKLDDLAAACFVNKYYLSHLFTRTVGCSIGVYITEKRLKQVCALLVQTKLPVVDLGRKCGFNDPAYLGKIFKARFGVTPSRYRRLHTDGGESPESEKPGGARS